jgi:glycosyltransferase involved in cell wall biosynthesis
VKIALVSTPFVSVPPKKYGGTELFLYHLAEKMIDRGHEVVLFATGDSRTRAYVECAFPSSRWPIVSRDEQIHLAFAAKRLLERDDIDVVHWQSPMAVPYASITGIPAVVTLHHSRTQDFSEIYRHYPENHYVAISHSQMVQEISLPHFSVIHHGLDPMAYPPSFGPGSHAAFLGRLAPEKGPDSACRVARKAGLPLHIGGAVHPCDTWFYNETLRNLFQDASVKWLGQVDHLQKVALLQGAKALLVPIRWEEPFGLVMIESMLCGTPVIAFKRGSATELVEDGVTGFLVDSEAEMADVLSHRVATIDRRACRARAVERFSTDVMVNGYESLYRSIAEGARNPGWTSLGEGPISGQIPLFPSSVGEEEGKNVLEVR